MDLNSLNMFVLVVQHDGFSEASRKSNIPVATISRRVSELEKQMGIRLLERSTRQVRTTKEGDLLYAFASRGLEEIQAGQLAIINANEQLKGTLRLSIPGDSNFWWTLLESFQLQYPNIHINILTTGRRVDLISDGIDVALRIGALKTQTAVARKLGSYRHCLVASPGYLKQHGMPENPEQLSNFPCGAWSRSSEDMSWELAGKKYPISADIQVNDFAHLLKLTLKGNILCEMPPLLVQPYLKSGELIQVLREYPFPLLTLSLLYPSRKYLSPLSRAYIDFAIKYCKDEELFIPVLLV